jgi:hypothetical protein
MGAAGWIGRTPGVGDYKGIWTLNEVYDRIKAGDWPRPYQPDEMWDFTRASSPLTGLIAGAVWPNPRAGNGSYFDSAGVLQIAGTDVARFTYDPLTLSTQRWLIEGARPNSLRNNTMVGAAPGSPGTNPTHWSASGSGDGLTQTIASPSVEAGIKCIDYRYVGTTSATNDRRILFEQVNVVAASPGQVWSASAFLSLAAGTLNGITAIRLELREYNSVAATLRTTTTTFAPTIAALRGQRRKVEGVTLGASTAFVTTSVEFFYSNAAAVDFTLRIGLPQIELGAFASSPIETSGAAVTRAADLPVITGLGAEPWFDGSGPGTLMVVGRVIGVAPGVVNVAAQVDDGSENNRHVQRVSTTGSWQTITLSGGANQGLTGNAAAVVGQRFHYAYGWDTNNLRAALDTVLSAADTSASLVSGMNAMRLGSSSGGSIPAFIEIEKLIYWKRRLPDDVLARITA